MYVDALILFDFLPSMIFVLCDACIFNVGKVFFSGDGVFVLIFLVLFWRGSCIFFLIFFGVILDGYLYPR